MCRRGNGIDAGIRSPASSALQTPTQRGEVVVLGEEENRIGRSGFLNIWINNDLQVLSVVFRYSRYPPSRTD